jgi:hypothetical protein
MENRCYERTRPTLDLALHALGSRAWTQANGQILVRRPTW